MSFISSFDLQGNMMLIAAGIVLVLLGISNYRYSQRARDLKKSCTVPVDAVIIGRDMRHTEGLQNSVGRYEYNCTYQYVYNGIMYTANNNVWSSDSHLKKGQKVHLLIDPNYPSSEIFDPVAATGINNAYLSLFFGIGVCAILIFHIFS